tara:strand:- start:227 stop:397 length:171 start_codon:yes stop_codon:yes gene_type:complete
MPDDDYENAIIKKPRLFDFIVAPTILFLILLIGHYGFFLGGIINPVTRETLKGGKS